MTAAPVVGDRLFTQEQRGDEEYVVCYHAATGAEVWTYHDAARFSEMVAGPGPRATPTFHAGRLYAFGASGHLSCLDAASGRELWHHSWPAENAARVVQPALVGNGDLLIGTGPGVGTRRIRVRRDGETWSTAEKWTSRKIRLYFNDVVVVNGYLYGFDLGKLVCIRLEDGSAAWRARGYGNGQVLLLADQGLLLVLSEDGDVALVSARPEKHEELCRFEAIEGKTWNHPVIAHGKLFVRNGEEIACFDIGEIAK